MANEVSKRHLQRAARFKLLRSSHRSAILGVILLERTFLRRYRAAFLFPLHMLGRLSKTIIALFAAAMLLMNVALVTYLPVFAFVSSLAEVFAGMPTVRARFALQADALAAENERLSARNTWIEAENARLRHELDGTRVTYRGERRLAREAVSDTNTRISRRVAFATARNTASMAGEALPFIGIGVIVGATAWEIADACQMMSDLYELEVAFNPDSAILGSEVCGREVPTAGEIWSEISTSPSRVWAATREMYDTLPDVSFRAYEWVLSKGGAFVTWILE